MQLKIYWVAEENLQRTLDAFKEKIKFITYYSKSDPALFCVIVDEEAS